MKIYHMMSGDGMAGFNRRLGYPAVGIAWQKKPALRPSRQQGALCLKTLRHP